MRGKDSSCILNKVIFTLGIVFPLFFLPQLSYAQRSEDTQSGKEVRLRISNDNFWPPFNDRYFTNGFELSYSRLISNEVFLGKLIPQSDRISLLRFRLGQELYTSKEIIERDVLEFDRPYAAFLYLTSEWESYWKRINQLQISIDAGIIGPGAQGKEVQTWWHRIFSMDEPQGWDYQIENGPVANLRLVYRRTWLYGSTVELSTRTGLATGLVYNYLQGGLIVRLGTIDILDSSTLGWNSLHRSSTDATINWFFFLEYDRSLVWQNTLIEGGIVKDSDNPHTEEAESYLNIVKIGFSLSRSKTGWNITANRLSPEVVGGGNHTYASFEFALRF